MDHIAESAFTTASVFSLRLCVNIDMLYRVTQQCTDMRIECYEHLRISTGVGMVPIPIYTQLQLSTDKYKIIPETQFGC
jgi:hypothetical protein